MPSTSSAHSEFLHRTTRGRVVYERRLHPFTEADLFRISRALFLGASPDPSILGQLLYRVSLSLLQIILGRVGASMFAPIVYAWLYRMVDYVLGEVRDLLVAGHGEASFFEFEARLASLVVSERIPVSRAEVL